MFAFQARRRLAYRLEISPARSCWAQLLGFKSPLYSLDYLGSPGLLIPGAAGRNRVYSHKTVRLTPRLRP